MPHTLEKYLASIPTRYRNHMAPQIYYLVRRGAYPFAEGRVHDLRPLQFGNPDYQENQDYAKLQQVLKDLITHHRDNRH